MSELRRVALAACAAAAMSVPATGLAQVFGGPESESYVGGSVGSSKANEWCDTVPAGSTCDDKDTAWGVFIGYKFNRNFGLEVGYRELGEVAITDPITRFANRADFKAFELTAVGFLPLGERFSLYGKFGAYFGETDTVIEAPGGDATGSDSNIELTYGVGLEYNFAKQFSVRAEWQRYQDVTGGSVDVDSISLGLVYRFK